MTPSKGADLVRDALERAGYTDAHNVTDIVADAVYRAVAVAEYRRIMEAGDDPQ